LSKSNVLSKIKSKFGTFEYRGCNECAWVKLSLEEVILDKTDEANEKVDEWTNGWKSGWGVDRWTRGQIGGQMGG